MKKGRAQITVFIILGVIILAAIALVMFLNSQGQKQELSKEFFLSNNIEPSVTNIESFSLDCLENSALDGLELIGIQGGYYKKPELNFDLEWAFIPYYYHKGSFLMPSPQKIESELASFVNDNIASCINDITFNNFAISYDTPATKTSIQPGKVIFTTNLKLTIESKGKTTLFEMQNHPVAINSSLFDIIKVATYITDSHKEDPDFICINCLTQLAKEKSLYVDFIAFEPDSTLIMIIENSTQPEPYVFEFLNKYEVK